MDEINFRNKILKTFIVVIFIIVLSYSFFSAPFLNKDIIIHISSNQSLNSISNELKEKRVIRSNFSLKIFVKLLKTGKGIIHGDYLIKKDSPVWVVAWQIGRGQHKIEPVKITIREGLTNEGIANILANKLSNFNRDLFLEKTQDKQGYLFPDTYFLFPLDTTEEIIGLLTTNFKNKTSDIYESLNKSTKKSFADIIKMASILEGEAKGKEDIYIISGILWKRISIGMPLQVDVDKFTYEEKGLPDKPLNNPGLLSIKAAINPTDSPYLYYLHDKNGKAYFSKDYEEHKNNINKYLK